MVQLLLWSRRGGWRLQMTLVSIIIASAFSILPPVATPLCRAVSGAKDNDHEVSHEKFSSQCPSWACVDDGRMQNDGPQHRTKRSLQCGGYDDLGGMDCGLPKRAEQSEDRQKVQGRAAEGGQYGGLCRRLSNGTTDPRKVL